MESKWRIYGYTFKVPLNHVETNLVTGVGSGIGHALAGLWLGEGRRLLGIGRRRPDDLVGCYDMYRFVFVAGDFARLDEIPAKMAELISGTKSIDCAVLNAGTLGEIGDLTVANLEVVKRTMDVNVWANKMIIDALVLSHIPVKQVVAISSGAAISGSRGWNGYAISKAALNMLVSLYAKELPETHFSSLAPGLVDTAMQGQICGLPDSDKTPMVARLRNARGTEAMPSPEVAARKIANIIPRLRERPSGSFADLREYQDC